MGMCVTLCFHTLHAYDALVEVDFICGVPYHSLHDTCIKVTDSPMNEVGDREMMIGCRMLGIGLTFIV